MRHTKNGGHPISQLSLFGLGVALGFLVDFESFNKLKLLNLGLISSSSVDLNAISYDLSASNFTANTSDVR